MASVMMPVFAAMAVACAAGLVFVVRTVHRYPNQNPDHVDLPDVPEDSPLRTWMRSR